MRTREEIIKEIDTIEAFILKYVRYFNEHGSGALCGKIAALQWVLEDEN